jgi:hypothetical protein
MGSVAQNIDSVNSDLVYLDGEWINLDPTNLHNSWEEAFLVSWESTDNLLYS